MVRRIRIAERLTTFTRVILSILLICLAGGLQNTVSAYFERIQAGPRATSMGRAFGALADDASATYWNPAALVTLQRSELILQYSKPFVISNLQSNFVGAVIPRDDISLGIYWHHTGVADVVGEDLLAIGVARDLLPPGGNMALAVGGAIKLAHVGFSDRGGSDYGRKVKLTADVSTLLNLTPSLSLSYVAKNLTEPTYEFVDGGGGTELLRTHDFGLAYRWHPASTCAVAYSKDGVGDWEASAGIEVWFYEVFGLRTGLLNDRFAGGVGLKTGQYLVDMAFVTHDELGVSYEVALRVPFGRNRW